MKSVLDTQTEIDDEVEDGLEAKINDSSSSSLLKKVEKDAVV